MGEGTMVSIILIARILSEAMSRMFEQGWNIIKNLTIC